MIIMLTQRSGSADWGGGKRNGCTEPSSKRVHKDCRMNSHRFREGFIQNASILDLKFYITSLVGSILLYKTDFFNKVRRKEKKIQILFIYYTYSSGVYETPSLRRYSQI